MVVPEGTARRFGDDAGCRPPQSALRGRAPEENRPNAQAISRSARADARARGRVFRPPSGSFDASDRENRMGTPSTC